MQCLLFLFFHSNYFFKDIQKMRIHDEQQSRFLFAIQMKGGNLYLREGDVIAGKYRILKLLGSGGEGCVYLVQHLWTDELRAVKIYKKDSETRSIHELHMMKQIRHPSLPRIIDAEQDNEGFCLVMEYVSGMTLSEYARKRIISENIFFSACEQLLDALEYLHTGRFPMLHLDVKPSNIIFREDGRLVLLDMGAAMPLNRINEGRSFCRGTAGYAAPEQFDPSGILTERTDLYGFGSTMYYLLHKRKYGESSYGCRQKECSALWKKRADHILHSCLQYEAESRPPSAHTVKKQLQKYKLWKSVRRTILQSAMSMILLISILFFAWSVPESRNSAMDIQQKYDALLEEAELSGNTQAFACYKKAVTLCPDHLEAFFHFMNRILDDLVFNAEEEEQLLSLLNLQVSFDTGSAFEMIQGGDSYGELAYHLGIAYWYFYEGSGGRSAAAAWFARAEKNAVENESSEYWASEAAVYARIGSYYEKLGKQKLPGMEEISPVTYWKDLEILSKLIFQNSKKEKENEAVKKSILEEMTNLLIFDSASLMEGGMQEQTLLDEISKMEQQGAEQILPGRCKDAREAVNRASRKYSEDM